MTNLLRCVGRKTGLMLAAIGLFGAANVQAESFPNDGNLQANVEYIITSADISLGSLSAVYIPVADGKMTYTCAGVFSPYYDEGHTTGVSSAYEGYVNGTQAYSVNVKKDVPIYFYADDWGLSSAFDGMIFQIVQGAPIDVVAYTEEPGTVLSVTSGIEDLVVTFNQPVKASKATFSVADSDASVDVELDQVFGSNMIIKYRNALYALMDSGDITGGEDIYLTIIGIENEAGEQYDNGNNLVIEYKAPAVPVRLVSVDLPDPFMAFWNEGDSAAVLTATFSGDISRLTYDLMYGNFEPGTTDNYTESGSNLDSASHAKVTIDGNVATIDFAGYKRTPEDMLESGKLYDEVSIKLVALDADGQETVGMDSGSAGSSTFVLPYKNNEIVTYVEEISAAGSETLDIYSIDGRRIVSNDVKSLNKGLYIINGKKVIVK